MEDTCYLCGTDVSDGICSVYADDGPEEPYLLCFTCWREVYPIKAGETVKILYR